MSIRKTLIAGLLSVAGLVVVSDRASAQVTLGAGGVRIGTGSGNGVVIPYNGNRSGVMVTTPNAAVNPSTGNVYSPAFNSPNGTTYYSPTTNSYYNPAVGNYNAAPTPYNQAYAYPQTYNAQPSPVYGPTPYQSYPAGGFPATAPVYRGVRVR